MIASGSIPVALSRLVAEAWSEYDMTDAECVVRPSIPILFFGEWRRYEESELRVVTVGLNPSRWEFPQGDPYSRFPLARGLRCSPAITADTERYLAALGAYFRESPYTQW